MAASSSYSQPASELIASATPSGMPYSRSRMTNSARDSDASTSARSSPPSASLRSVFSTTGRKRSAPPSSSPRSWMTANGCSSESAKNAVASAASPASSRARLSGASFEPAMASMRMSTAVMRVRSHALPMT